MACRVEDLVDSGKIPEEFAERYEALAGADMSELQDMVDTLQLPSEGSSKQLAFRIVRFLAGLPPTSDAALREVPKLDAGPSKAKLKQFLVNFLSNADLESTTIGQLKEAAKEEFELMTDEAIKNLRDLAAGEMRKQLTARNRKRARMEAEETMEEPGNAGENADPAPADEAGKEDPTEPQPAPREPQADQAAAEPAKAKNTTCPACGNTYLDDSRFCRKCGRKRDEEAEGVTEEAPKDMEPPKPPKEDDSDDSDSDSSCPAALQPEGPGIH
ncbi:Aurkb [Symbiodinium natans]|uniref:Aurkb protein n=1 Tax=Symbiodinium natans TaxID=878477 RepID=A0A812TTJ8_9DINO|nr:Aurkb [Symbiodinium natans]